MYSPLREMESSLKNIASALTEEHGEEAETKAYFSKRELLPSNITIEVESVGTIELPLSKCCIESLIDVPSKATYGQIITEENVPENHEVAAAKTSEPMVTDENVLKNHEVAAGKTSGPMVTDENVPKNHEIPADKLRVTIEQSYMTQLLSNIHKELQLHESCELSPHLCNMQIYGPGQSSDLHQDTTKMDNVIATLLVVLPSPHIGGGLVIQHGNKKQVFNTENVYELASKCISFCGGCLHKVEKVTHGYQVVLTFHLMSNSSKMFSDEENERLKVALQEYFCDEHSKEPKKLMYLLNYEYPEHSLKWGLLKATDRINASAIINAAKGLQLVPHFAVVEISKPYSKEKATLSYLVNPSNQKVSPGTLEFNFEEICWTKGITRKDKYRSSSYDSDSDDYYDYHHYGEYRRSAVVLWEESRQITMNFLFNRETALNELQELTNTPGHENLVIDIVRKSGQYLYGGSYLTEGDFITLGNIVLYSHDKKVATEVLSHFSQSVLKVRTAETLAKLQNEFGIDWCMYILEKLKKHQNICNIDNIEDFIKTFLQNKGDMGIAELVLEQQIGVVDEKDYYYGLPYWRSLRSQEGLEKLSQMFKACAIIQNVNLQQKCIKIAIASPGKYPILELTDLFLKLKDEMSSEFYSHFKSLKTYLLNAVIAELGNTNNFAKDWSVKVTKTVTCKCEPCTEAIEFLASKVDEKKRWAIGLKFRNHVISKLGNLHLPIDITVEKDSVPHRLVITKRPVMHGEALEKFNKLKSCQEALNLIKF